MAGVQLSNIHKSYEGGAEVIRDVSLDIADGEFCVFVGPSGCGKSTLLRMVAGLEDISSGEMRIGGARVNELAPSERNVAMVFQNYALYPHLDVAENMAFGLRLTGMKTPEIKTRVANIAKTLEIEHLLERKPKALSGGQRQRVAIGRALVRDPGVFLFDEPLSNLDAALRTQMRVEIARLHRSYGKASTIYVTHDQVEAMTLADKIVLLHTGADVAKHGSIAQVGSPMELYANPRNLFVAGFIGSPKMNLLPATVTQVSEASVTLQLRDGASITAAVRPGPVTVGEAVTLGIRSEHLMLAHGGDNTIACKVQWVEQLGDTTFAYLDTADGQKLTLRLPGETPLAEGEALSLRVPPQRAHVFDAQGQALKKTI
ncbi:ABC transporter ATP-binding protein [Pelomonas sp. KK5]|uniref:ABC transporter ATP-binding protein n=1 Tax=Pelomonas sp. KK5 TaxID=1855730 RepID=UPI00097C582D|nr:sn-glycerol-3-phosphate ABC transporter ATP-binding protein UgpC [Pelomonas sp. KK5]